MDIAVFKQKLIAEKEDLVKRIEFIDMQLALADDKFAVEFVSLDNLVEDKRQLLVDKETLSDQVKDKDKMIADKNDEIADLQKKVRDLTPPETVSEAEASESESN